MKCFECCERILNELEQIKRESLDYRGHLEDDEFGRAVLDYMEELKKEKHLLYLDKAGRAAERK